MIKILTDNSSDLPENIKKKYNITSIPFNIVFKKEEFKDNEVSINDFFCKIKKMNIIPKTSQINNLEWKKNMIDLTKGKNDELLVFTLSSTLSGTYNEAVIARDSIGSSKIEIIDGGGTLLTTGLILEAIELIEKGKNFKEIVSFFKNRKRQECFFMVDNLDFLKKGGRINFTQALIGGILNIKPILKYNEEGKIISFDKAKGQKKALEKIIDFVKKYRTDRYLMISHANNQEGANFLINLVRQKLKEEPKIVSLMGPVISSHTGPGCIFISF